MATQTYRGYLLETNIEGIVGIFWLGELIDQAESMQAAMRRVDAWLAAR